jgi:hypothetical protein
MNFRKWMENRKGAHEPNPHVRAERVHNSTQLDAKPVDSQTSTAPYVVQ